MAPAVDDIELSDLDWWTGSLDARAAAFATLRAERPVAPMVMPGLPEMGIVETPYYSITRHADIVQASRHPELFCSGEGTNIADLPPDFREFFGSMINMDDPPARAHAPDRVPRVHAPPARAHEGRRRGHRRRDRRRDRRAGRGRLRHRGRRPAAAADHPRHDGHPPQPGALRLRPHQRHPRVHRPRVRRRHRRPDGDHRRHPHRRRRAGPAGQRAGRGPDQGPGRRPGLGPGRRGGRRRS